MANNVLGNRIAISIIFTGIIVHFILSACVAPGYDEAYYGVYSFFLNWGYFDHPPAVALVSGIGYWITGSSSYISLRIGTILLFSLSSVILYKFVKEAVNEKAAIIALLLFNLTPFFFIGIGLLVLPDNSLYLFWLIFLYSVFKIKKTGNAKWFLISGGSLGFALLSKYHAVLLLAGLFWLLLFTKEFRKYLKSPYLYLGLILAFLIFFPNIYWNYNNGWISYFYQFGKSTGHFHFSLNSLLQGIFSQAGYLMPWNFFIYLSSVYFIFHNESEYKWLLPFILLPILFFTFVSSFRPILPHWPMPGYIAAIVTASLWISKWKMRSIKYYFIASFLFLLILIPVAAIHSVKGILPIDKKVDVTLDGQGWNEIAAILEKDGLLNSVSFLFTNKWFTACEIHYALGNRFPVTVLNVEESNSYALWFDNKDILGKDGIFVTPDRYPFDPNELYPNNFTSIEFIGEYKTFRSGNEGQCFKVWLCKNLQNYQAHKYRNE